MPKIVEALQDTTYKDLHLDDIVVSTCGGRPNLYLMKVVGFGPKQISLELLEDVKGKTYNYSKGETINRFPHSVSLVQTYDGRPV